MYPLDLKKTSMIGGFVSVIIELEVLWPARVEAGIDTEVTPPQTD